MRQARYPAATSVSFSVWNSIPSRRRFCRSRLWFESEPLWTRQRSKPVEHGCEQAELARARRDGSAIDRDTRAVRSPVGELHEHCRHVGAEPVLDLARLAEESDDPAHVS